MPFIFFIVSRKGRLVIITIYMYYKSAAEESKTHHVCNYDIRLEG